jgi:hypothetical protein
LSNAQQVWALLILDPEDAHWILDLDPELQANNQIIAATIWGVRKQGKDGGGKGEWNQGAGRQNPSKGLFDINLPCKGMSLMTSNV